ncbi:MAG TPA: YicC/YloC family endoribonuclease [Gemmata sp.]|nr:YicC/YloC family endoribonuclease [Gemmata sp.]
MTGFGEARTQTDGLSAGVEVRAVNNRHLKVTVRGTDPYPMFEAELEKVVRRHVRRGTVTVHVRVDRQARPADLNLNTAALVAYLRQIRTACDGAGTPEFAPALVAGVLTLPGLAPEARHMGSPPDEEWPLVERTLEGALTKLDEMRREEGRAMAAELLALHGTIRGELDAVRLLLPAVTSDYRTRLLERVRQAVSDAGVVVHADNLIREVALFAERTDVAEEVTRLSAHLDQFSELVRKGEEAGRKLEFVIQEMNREANTLGSKAGDVAVSRHVFEIKATLEKVRELVQNVE